MSQVRRLFRGAMHAEWIRSLLEQLGFWSVISSVGGALIVALWDALSGLGSPVTTALITFVCIYVFSVAVKLRSHMAHALVPLPVESSSEASFFRDEPHVPLDEETQNTLLHFHRRFAEPAFDAARDVIYALHSDARPGTLEYTVRRLMIDYTSYMTFPPDKPDGYVWQRETARLLDRHVNAVQWMFELSSHYAVELKKIHEFEVLKRKDDEYTAAFRELIANPKFSDCYMWAGTALSLHERRRADWS